MHKYLKYASKQALNHTYDEGIDYFLCAVIVKGGSIVSIGFNKRSTNAFVEHYTDLIRGGYRDFALSTHAEMDAVSQVRQKVDLRGAKIFVARIRRDRSESVVGMARPCEICQTILEAYGITRAYYTIGDSEYGVLKIGDNKSSDKTYNVENAK